MATKTKRKTNFITPEPASAGAVEYFVTPTSKNSKTGPNGSPSLSYRIAGLPASGVLPNTSIEPNKVLDLNLELMIVKPCFLLKERNLMIMFLS